MYYIPDQNDVNLFFTDAKKNYLEAKTIEEKANKRIKELVAKSVASSSSIRLLSYFSILWLLLYNLFFYRRQKELEAKNIEEEANKRIEELVAKRVEEELERRREEIEAEVMRRVEEAKKIMEAKMMEEMERRKKEQQEEINRREVRILLLLLQIRIPNANSDSGFRSDRHPQKLILEDDCFFLEWNTKTKR